MLLSDFFVKFWYFFFIKFCHKKNLSQLLFLNCCVFYYFVEHSSTSLYFVNLQLNLPWNVFIITLSKPLLRHYPRYMYVVLNKQLHYSSLVITHTKDVFITGHQGCKNIVNWWGGGGVQNLTCNAHRGRKKIFNWWWGRGPIYNAPIQCMTELAHRYKLRF